MNLARLLAGARSLALGLALVASSSAGTASLLSAQDAPSGGEGVTPILRFEELLDAPVLGRDKTEVARLNDLIVHRRTGLVTRAVVRVDAGQEAVLKALAYTELAWDPERAALTIDASLEELRALADFDPARIARESARWARREGEAEGPARAEARPKLLHLLARHQLGRALFLEDEQIGSVGTLYVAPTEGRIVAWTCSRATGVERFEVLLAWPVVTETLHDEDAPPRLELTRGASAFADLVRFAPAAPRDLGRERPRLRALFRAFGEDPPNVLLAPAERTLVTRR